MTRWAIGDVQGCCTELDELLDRIHFNIDRDLLWFTGDLVNRGPQSLATLRRVRSFAANAVVVLGNHDLHLLAVAFVPGQAFFADGSGPNTFRVSFSCANDKMIDEGISRLGKLIASEIAAL